MTVDIHFLDTPAGQIVAGLLDGILNSAGSNFTPPYDSNFQPADGNAFNAESLIQFQLPGGGALQGYSEPGWTQSISSAINSALAAFAPFLSAYALILPIIGVIRGIIEIICALLNPFAVIAAVIRLFSKWIPPFISLFPPFAGIILILNIIKAIIAVVFFILTVVLPTLELIKQNIQSIGNALDAGPDSSEQAAEAGRQKIRDLIAELIQQSGLLGVLQPILEIMSAIIGISAGFPCGDGKSDVSADCGNGSSKSNLDNGSLVPPIGSSTGSDSSICGGCPDIISDPDAAPRGLGVLVSSSFCDYEPSFVFELVTNNSDIRKLESYIQSKEKQLEGCLDEPIRFARPVGATQDTSLVKVKLKSRRGSSREITVPVLDIDDTNLKIMSPLARLFVGTINYEIQIDHDMMVMNGIMGAGCHPSVRAVKENLENRFSDLNTSVSDRFPEAASLNSEFNSMVGSYNDLLGRLNENNTEDEIDDISNGISNLLNGFNNNLLGKINGILSKLFDTSASEFTVNREKVKADNIDKAIITVKPKDLTGSLLLKNTPSGTGLNIEILSSFGSVVNKTTDTSTGSVTAEIISPLIGSADITAKINGEYLTQAGDTQDSIKTLNIRFISDSTLPARRKKTKVSSDLIRPTGHNTEKSPRK